METHATKKTEKQNKTAWGPRGQTRCPHTNQSCQVFVFGPIGDTKQTGAEDTTRGAATHTPVATSLAFVISSFSLLPSAESSFRLHTLVPTSPACSSGAQQQPACTKGLRPSLHMCRCAATDAGPHMCCGAPHAAVSSSGVHASRYARQFPSLTSHHTTPAAQTHLMGGSSDPAEESCAQGTTDATPAQDKVNLLESATNGLWLLCTQQHTHCVRSHQQEAAARPAWSCKKVNTIVTTHPTYVGGWCMRRTQVFLV